MFKLEEKKAIFEKSQKILKNYRQKFKVDADNYSLKAIGLSTGITSFLVTVAINPLDVAKFRLMRTINGSAPSQLSERANGELNPLKLQSKDLKSRFGRLIPKNNLFLMTANLIKNEGFSAASQGSLWASSLFLAKNTTFILVYESGKQTIIFICVTRHFHFSLKYN
jgi:hypothetical protein